MSPVGAHGDTTYIGRIAAANPLHTPGCRTTDSPSKMTLVSVIAPDATHRIIVPHGIGYRKV
jgi:hypothetical protein